MNEHCIIFGVFAALKTFSNVVHHRYGSALYLVAKSEILVVLQKRINFGYKFPRQLPNNKFFKIPNHLTHKLTNTQFLTRSYLGCWQSSVRTPFVLLGWRKAIIKFSAPLRGALSMSCSPAASASFNASSTFSTLNATW